MIPLAPHLTRRTISGLYVVQLVPTVLPVADLSRSAVAARAEARAQAGGVDDEMALAYAQHVLRSSVVGRAVEAVEAGGECTIRLDSSELRYQLDRAQQHARALRPAVPPPEPPYDSPEQDERLRMLWGKRVHMPYPEAEDRAEMIDEVLAELELLPETRSE